MTPQEIAQKLLEQYEKPEFEQLIEEQRPLITLELIAHLKKRVDEEKLKDAHLALRIATLAQALVPYINEPEAEALAYWAKGTALLHLSRYQEALESYESAAAIYVAQGQKVALVGIQAPMVEVLRALGEHQAALALAEEARAICLALGTPAQRYLAYLEMNVGIVYDELGNPEATLQAYLRARSLFVQLGDTIQAARIDINRSIILREMSRFVMAQELLLGARQVLASKGHLQQVARVDANLGILAHRRGRYQEALAYFETARQGFADMSTLIALVDLRRGLIYRKLNLIQETIELAVAVEPIFAQNGMLTEQARALYQQGVGYQLGGHYALAESYLMKARQLLQQLKKGAIVFELDYDLACLARDTGRLDDARQLALRLTLEVAPDTWPRLAAQAQLLLAECALQSRELDSAHHYAREALELAGAYSLHETVIAAHHLIGQILESTAQPQQAWSQYQRAMQQIESLGAHLLVDEFRIGFMDDKLPIYADAVRLSQQIATPAQVLYTLNLAQTSPWRNEAYRTTNSPDNKIESELAALREKWHWYQNKLEEADSDTSATLCQLRTVETKLAELWRRLQVLPISDQPVAPKLSGQISFDLKEAEQFLASIQQRLGPNEVLLHYYLVNDAFQALLVTPLAIQLFPNLASTKSLDRILRGWNRQLTHIGLISQSPETSKSLALRYLARLYQALVAPLTPLLANEGHLLLVMPPDWHNLPLAAFFDGERYLVERYQVTYLSAPEVLLGTAPESRSTLNKRALIIGHSDGGRLSGIQQATKTVAENLPAGWQSTFLMDAEATFDNFQAASRNSHLIHLATHATFRPDNPLFSWARLAGHRLTVAELYQMKLPQKPLVVLSACETGRGKARGGGLLGMGRALLGAGASGLVVTLWRVEDQLTAQLMVDFYAVIEDNKQLQSHQDVSTMASLALFQAQKRAIVNGLHPFFWAGFIFIQG